jgi:rod shape-determining protein MreD
MAYLIGVPLLALLAVLQSATISYIHLLDGRPDLILLAVVSWGLVGRHNEAMVWGMVGGFFLDLLSGLPVGSNALILILVAFLVSLMEGRFWEAHLLMPLGVTLLASLLFHGLSLATLLLSGRGLDMTFTLTRVVLPSTFLNVALVLPSIQLFEGLRYRLFPPEVEI